MKKLLYKLNKLVEKHKLFFVLVLVAASLILLFLPFTYYDKQPSMIKDYSIFSGLIAQLDNRRWYLEQISAGNYPAFEYDYLSILNLQITLSVSLFLIFVINSVISVFKRKTILFTTFCYIIISIVFISGLSEYKKFGFYNFVPSIGFYIAILLFLFQLTYIITSIYFKRHPNYVPPLPKPKKLSNKERIALLEEQVRTMRLEEQLHDFLTQNSKDSHK